MSQTAHPGTDDTVNIPIPKTISDAATSTVATMMVRPSSRTPMSSE
jgi:hypothetical protein